jgi:hypothetical protein
MTSLSRCSVDKYVSAVRTTSCRVLLERAQLWDETREYAGVDEVA